MPPCARQLYAVGRFVLIRPLLRDNLARSDQLVMNCRRDRFKLFSPVMTAPTSRSPPLSIRFVHLPTQKSNGGQAMKIINLRDYYPFYTQDPLLEISDEVAQAMAEAERLERNYNTLIIKLLFPLRNPMNPDTLSFGGISTSIWI